jgi:protein-S-isoprenylcysteine O-methyltransferase Ste14
MGLDIRWPIGLMFSLIGAILVIMGLVSPGMSNSLDININLWWGLVLVVFGVLMLFGAVKGGKNKGDPPSA